MAFEDDTNICAARSDLTIVRFSAPWNHEAPLLTSYSPHIAERVKSLATTRLFLPLRIRDSAVVWSPNIPHPIEHKEFHALSVGDTTALGWELHGALSSIDGKIALVISSEPHLRPLRFAVSSNYSVTSAVPAAGFGEYFALSKNVLLVALDNATDTSAREVARIIVSWLVDDLYEGCETESHSKWKECVAARTRGVCLSSAAHSIKRFLDGLAVSPKTDVSLHVLSAALQAIEAYNGASSLDSTTNKTDEIIAKSRSAWSLARALLTHPDTALKPHMPVEHILALLLPLGLPILLSLAQAIAKEARSYSLTPNKLKVA